MCSAGLSSVCKNNTPPFGVILGVFWNSALDGNTHIDTSSRSSDTRSSRTSHHLVLSNQQGAPIAAVPAPRFPECSVPQIASTVAH